MQLYYMSRRFDPSMKKTGSHDCKSSAKFLTFATLLDFAHESGGSVGRRRRSRNSARDLSVDNKATGRDFDPVTAADRDAETRDLRIGPQGRFPEHGIVGEEFGDHNSGGKLKWVIDPIDGTRAFIMGTPMWGTLIGLLDGATPLLGIMDQPFTRERFWSDATSAHLRTHDGAVTRLKTRSCPRIEDADPHHHAPGAVHART